MINRVRKTELLSPAGSFDSARAAVNAGADAIYMGGPFFSARAFAESSAKKDEEEARDMLAEAIDFCHLRGVKVFMTLNTLLKEQEISCLEEYLAPYAAQHLDGAIIQDLGVFRKVRELFPELELHVSTQAAITGWRTAKRYMEMGAKRIVLARELSLEDIREIREKTGAELEVFAHGALCYSYSGDCLMSSFIGGRSGNRGKCAGTCRLPFDLLDENGKQLNKKNEQYLLSMCDLNTLSRLQAMIDAGVYSFKIEGRMKSPLYTAAVTSVYRKYLDMAETVSEVKSGTKGLRIEKKDMEMLSDVFDRAGSTDGYLDGLNGRAMLTMLAKPEFRSHNEELITALKEKYIENDIRVPIEAEVEVKIGRAPKLKLTSGNTSVELEADVLVGAAEKRPVTREDVAEKISKFGGTDFELCSLKADVDDHCFVPVKALNELRRNAADELTKRLLTGER